MYLAIIDSRISLYLVGLIDPPSTGTSEAVGGANEEEGGDKEEEEAEPKEVKEKKMSRKELKKLKKQVQTKEKQAHRPTDRYYILEANKVIKLI